MTQFALIRLFGTYLLFEYGCILLVGTGTLSGFVQIEYSVLRSIRYSRAYQVRPYRYPNAKFSTAVTVPVLNLVMKQLRYRRYLYQTRLNTLLLSNLWLESSEPILVKAKFTSPEHPVSFSYGDSSQFEAGIRVLWYQVVSSGGQFRGYQYQYIVQ